MHLKKKHGKLKFFKANTATNLILQRLNSWCIQKGRTKSNLSNMRIALTFCREVNMLKHQWDFKIPEIINLLWIKGSNDKSWQKNQKFNLLIERENPYNREKIYINHLAAKL